MSDNKSPDDLRSRYRAIKEERQRRIDEYKRSIAARPATATNLKILADGDSWFKYSPSMNVIDFIHQDGNPDPLILNLAVAGDPTTATLGVSKRQHIIDNLSDPENGNFDALLFSGGGDDVVGDQFCLWVTQNVGSGNGVNTSAFSDIMGVVETAYTDLFRVCGSIQPNLLIRQLVSPANYFIISVSCRITRYSRPEQADRRQRRDRCKNAGASENAESGQLHHALSGPAMTTARSSQKGGHSE